MMFPDQPSPIILTPLVLTDHTFGSRWNVTAPQQAGAIVVSVAVYDLAGLVATTTCSVIVSFQQINHAPVWQLTQRTAYVHELASAGTVLLPLNATDVDTAQNLMFDVSSSWPGSYPNFSTNLFAVSSSTHRGIGALMLASNHLDYEVTPLYNVSIRVHDDGMGVIPSSPPELFAFIVVTVVVIDDEDSPVVLSVTGGTTLGLLTSGGEFVFIVGRYFGAATPGGLLTPPGGGSWMATQLEGGQSNLQVTILADDSWQAASCAVYELSASYGVPTRGSVVPGAGGV